MTPYYADASVTVHAGDCLDVLRALPDVRELTIDHLKLCDTCPIKDACWAENGDEDWVQRLQVEEYQRAKAAQR